MKVVRHIKDPEGHNLDEFGEKNSRYSMPKS